MDLLSQLLEDIDACTTKLESQDTLKDFASFLGVYNTVLKCIYTSGEFFFTYLKKLKKYFRKIKF